MASASNELIGVATAFLRTYAPLVGLIGQNKIVYRADQNMAVPYVTVDDAFTVRDDMACLDSVEVTLNIHVWTEGDCIADSCGPLQDARTIGALVIAALHRQALSLPSNTLVTLESTGERVFYDADGVSGHGVFAFNAVVESALE
jgi:hypothetical protein